MAVTITNNAVRIIEKLESDLNEATRDAGEMRRGVLFLSDALLACMKQNEASEKRIAELEESLRDMIFYFADAAVYDEDEIAVVDNARSLLSQEPAP